MKLFSITLVGIIMLLYSPRIEALRCHGKIISPGDPTLKVKKLCGNPAVTEKRTFYREIHRQYVQGQRYHETYYEQKIGEKLLIPIIIDQWLYDFGSSRFLYRLVFKDGVLDSIKSFSNSGFYDSTKRPKIVQKCFSWQSYTLRE